MSEFVIWREWRKHSFAKVSKETPTLYKLERTMWPRQIAKTKAVALVSDEEAAKLLCQSLDGIWGEYNRRERAAREDYDTRLEAAGASRNKAQAALIAKATGAE